MRGISVFLCVVTLNILAAVFFKMEGMVLFDLTLIITLLILIKMDAQALILRLSRQKIQRHNEQHLRQSLDEQKASQLDEKDLPSERDVKRLIEEDPL
ncbi:hypothetical protein ABE504_18335 [Paenibacillus oryzisoli]|uniref:hypothetical protein n=1 Tax=Paenibacillus oryzisoli TaxID=1850517 RepID=UPI003D26B655